ncbi:MAG: transcription termination factor NusA [Syntrophomonadaceae bacterium]|jgi:N utilization substance protein A|nr:transcription termination factor NusA [Syntrophomonadaceae bacterium]MDH7498302.1 transcription termination factor NusA [Syntrophomonadaceae bacterium]
MASELILALGEIERERGIPKEVLIEAIESALKTAYKKNFGSAQNVNVEMDAASGTFKVYAVKQVVEEVTDPRLEISLEEARRIRPDAELEQEVEVEVTPTDFGRIAAQTAKQVVIQRLREAERSLIFQEYAEREGEVVTGTVQRVEQRVVVLNLGRTEGIMLPQDQIGNEHYEVGQRLKAYISEVKRTAKGPQIFVSRAHPNFLKRLFELEVPEIYDGLVEIKSIAREAGARSKVAVYSRDERVDPVGACVGPRGFRVQNIVKELNGEKIDIIKWSPDPEQYIANALSPSKVVWVDLREGEKMARVVVPDYQLSLAIGKEGQNARLAAKLTGWKIDIKSESQMAELQGQRYGQEEYPEYEEYEEYEQYEEYEEGAEGGEYGEGEEYLEGEEYPEEGDYAPEEFDEEYDEAVPVEGVDLDEPPGGDER